MIYWILGGVALLPLVLFAILVAIYSGLTAIHKDDPFDILESLEGVPKEHKLRAIECFKEAAELDARVMWYDLSAPFVVPFILLFTKWEDERLAFWDDIYGNNADFRRSDGTLVGGINGDNYGVWETLADGTSEPKRIPIEDTPEARSLAYWVNGKHHPRSFYARWVWLGLRNRASKASYALGVDMRPINADRESWGDKLTIGRSHEGTILYRCGDKYQLYSIKFVSETKCIRVNVGYKVWMSMLHKDAYIAPPVNIVYSKISRN